MSAERKICVPEETLARAKQLQAAGFVHVTGLRVSGSACDSYRIQARRKDLGCSNGNNGKVVVVTADGEVWLGVGSAEIPSGICSRCGGFVPCSNGEQICTHSLLRRVSNPYDDCHGEFSPVPEIQP